jgi:hypothetical protein
MDKYRFYTLLESKLGNSKPLISENKLKDERYLNKKQQLLDYLYTIGLESDKDTKEVDINNDGEMDTELFTFDKGNVVMYLGICNFSNGDIKYLCHIKTKPNYDIVLQPTFVGSLEELQSNIEPYIEQSYEDTKLDYLGVKNQQEYVPTKKELNDLINQALDNGDFEEVTKLQNMYGNLYS